MKDLIDRRTAIDAVLDRMDVEKYGRNAKPEEIQWALEKLPSAQPEQQWIPCSKQLPKNGHEYLYCTDMGTVHMGVYWSGLGFGYGFKYVVAWMPLPEPYREDDHEND